MFFVFKRDEFKVTKYFCMSDILLYSKWIKNVLYLHLLLVEFEGTERVTFSLYFNQ